MIDGVTPICPKHNTPMWGDCVGGWYCPECEDDAMDDAIKEGLKKGTYFGKQGWVCKKCHKTDEEITFWFTKDLCLDCSTREERFEYWIF